VCDRIEAWHQQNPGHMAAQLFCKIVSPPSDTSDAAAPPKSRTPRRQRHPRHPVSPRSIHPVTTTTRPARATTEGAEGFQVTNKVSQRVLEAPITVSQQELRALAPDTSVQAASELEPEHEEPVALAMLSKVLSDQYELDEPATTPRSARLAQIADNYVAAALTPSSNTLPLPFLSKSQPATDTSSEGEPVAPPPPILTIPPPAAAEVTSSIVVAAEAPLSPITAAQQQSALSFFPFLPRHTPIVPFSSLLTSYHHVPDIDSLRRFPIPNFLRNSLQLPQRRPPCEPPPEQADEVSEDELSDSQSSPSSSSPEPEDHPFSSAVDLVAPLAASLREELACIWDVIAQETGSAEHKYSAALRSLEDKLNALVALAHELDRHATDSPEPEHTDRFSALMDQLGTLMTLSRAVERSAAEGHNNPKPEATTNSAAPSKHDAASAEYSGEGNSEGDEGEGEESGRSSSCSCSGEAGELTALSWEEIPSPACIPPIPFTLSSPEQLTSTHPTIPSSFRSSFFLSSLDPPSFSTPADNYSRSIHFYSPHTRAHTNPKPRTAIFSVGRRIGVARSLARPQPRPSPHLPPRATSTPQPPRQPFQRTAASYSKSHHVKTRSSKRSPKHKTKRSKVHLHQRRHKHLDTNPKSDSPSSSQSLSPLLNTSLRTLQPHQCLVLALPDYKPKRRSRKQDDFTDDDEDFAPIAVGTHSLDERFSDPRHPLGNTSNWSNEDAMNLEMSYLGSSSFTFSTTPHAPAGFKTSPQRTSSPGGNSYHIARRAETCTTVRAQDCLPIPSREEQLAPTAPQSAALVRGLNNSVSTCPGTQTPFLSSSEARRAVLDHLRFQTVPYPLRWNDTTSLAFSTIPHPPALLAALPRRFPHPDCFLYQVTRRAEACTIFHTQDFLLNPSREQLLVMTFPQRAVPFRGLSYFVQTHPGPRQPQFQSFATCKDMHDCLRSRSAPQPLRKKNSSVEAFLKGPHLRAVLGIGTQHVQGLKNHAFRVSRRAETCTTTRAPDYLPILLTAEPPALTSAPSAAPLRRLSNSDPMRSHYSQTTLQVFALRRSVQGSSRLQTAPHPFPVEESSLRASSRGLHLRAALVLQTQLDPDLNNRSYQVAQRAEGCTATRALSWPLLPLSSEKFTQTFPQITALVRRPSNSSPTFLRLRYPPTKSYARCRGMPDRSHPRSAPQSLRKKNTSLQSSPIVQHLRAALVFRDRRFLCPDGLPIQVSQRANACATVHILIWYPICWSTEQPALTSPPSSAPSRGHSYSYWTRSRYCQTPVLTLEFCRAVRSSSRARSASYPLRTKDSSSQRSPRTPHVRAALATKTGRARSIGKPFYGVSRSEKVRVVTQGDSLPLGLLALRFKTISLRQRCGRSSLRLERTEDSPDLSWEEMMHRARGSTRRNALRSDLEPGAQRGGAVDRQAGGAATRMPQPQPQPLHHHTILIFHQSRTLSILSDLPQTQQEDRETALRQISSKSGRSGALIPLNVTKTTLACLKTPKARVGLSGSNKRRPQWGLVPSSRPCHVGRRPTSRAASQGPGECT
jgi:hypothetical protein